MAEPLASRPEVSVSVTDRDVYLATPDGGTNLDLYGCMYLIARLTEAMTELWPDNDKHWKSDPNREDLSGRIGKSRANKQRREQ